MTYQYPTHGFHTRVELTSGSGSNLPLFAFYKTEADFLWGVNIVPACVHVLEDVEDLSKDALEKFATLLGAAKEHGAFPGVRDIVYKPSQNPDSVALSDGEHPHHVDGTFAQLMPKAFLLACVTPDSGGGGASTFLRQSDILCDAPPKIIAALAGADYSIVRKRDDGSEDGFIGPLLESGEHGESIFRWRADHQVRPQVVNDNGHDAQAALDWIAAKIDTLQPEVYSAKAGDLMYIRNTGVHTAVLHGRTELVNPEARRYLRLWLK